MAGEQIEIQPQKSRLVLAVMLSALFIAIGLQLVFANTSITFFNDPVYAKTVRIAFFSILGLNGLFMLRIFSRNHPKVNTAFRVTVLLVCIWLVVDAFITPPRRHDWQFESHITLIVARTIGIAIILYSSFLGIFSIRKLLDGKPVITTTKEGIINNSGMWGPEMILWSDIKGYKVVDLYLFSQPFLILMLNNPEEYINKCNNFLQKMAMKANYKRYGTPIVVSTNAIDYQFYELQKVIESNIH